jgi:hypothetical protein
MKKKRKPKEIWAHRPLIKELATILRNFRVKQVKVHKAPLWQTSMNYERKGYTWTRAIVIMYLSWNTDYLGKKAITAVRIQWQLIMGTISFVWMYISLAEINLKLNTRMVKYRKDLDLGFIYSYAHGSVIAHILGKANRIKHSGTSKCYHTHWKNDEKKADILEVWASLNLSI